jgi:hypothetical protein
MTMATIQRYSFAGTANEHSSVMTAVANSVPRQIEKMYESFDYMEFALTNLLGKSNKAAYAIAQEFTDERYPPVTDTLAEALDNSETGVDVTDGNRYQVYNLIQIDDEIMWVTAIASNTLTVTRGSSIGSTSATHDSGATIYIVSTATPENVAAVASVTMKGDTVTNYMQIFQHALKVSERADNGGSYLIGSGKAEGPSNEFAWELARQFRQVAREREQAAWRGVPFAGSASLPSTMGGIPAFITENTLDLGGQPFTPMQMMDLSQDAWNAGGPAGMSRMIFAGAVARRAMSSFYKVNVQMTPRDRRVSLIVDEVETELGTFELTEANFWIPPALVVCIDPDNYKWRAWGGYGEVHKSDLAIDGAYNKGAITCDYTLLCGGNRVSWKMTDASITATDYPGLNGG